MQRDRTTRPGHPIRVVARRTGLTPEVIRVWEKRYDAVTPMRTSTGRRLYSDAEVERLILLRRATMGGRSIGEIAHRETGALAALVRADEAAEAAAPVTAVARAGETRAGLLAATLAAVEELDAPALRHALLRAARVLGADELLEGLVEPLMRTIGERWQAGRLGVGHEHLATALVRSLLDQLRESRMPAFGGPVLVVTTPAQELHELGAMVVAAVAGSEGWDAVYLGPNLPAAAIAAAAERPSPRAVALSVASAASDDREFVELRRLLSPRIELLVGGGAVGERGPLWESIGARRITTLTGLRAELARIGGEAAGN